MGKEAELIKAAKKGDLKFLERYLGQQNKRTSVIGSIRKPMHPNVQDDLGYTLLHHATLNGHTEIVSFLLSCGASTTLPDSSGSYPLHLASWKGDLEIVTLLVSHGMSRPNVDQQSNSEDTALHLASQYGYSPVVEFLLERHANPMLKNVRGETPLDLASQFGHLDTVHVLISHCPELLTFSRPEISSLHLAARNGHTVVVLSLINAGIPVNTLCTGGTALHEAAMCGKEDTVKLLLDKGIDPTMKDSKGNTALNLLSQIPAQTAQKIHQLISQYTNKMRIPKERYMTPRKYRLLAVPIRDSETRPTNGSNSEQEETDALPQLEYRKDESIVIQGRQSPDMYIGVLHKVLGTFPIKDMRIFQDIDGKLHEVMKDDVIDFAEDGGIHIKQKNSQSHRKDSGEKRKDKAKSKRQHRMTDQEKKFVLSKDTGTYCQLKPVSAPSTESAEIKQVSPPPTDGASGSNTGEYLGNYYLLEVGTIETSPPTSPSNDERDDIPSPPNYPAPQLRDDIPPPPIEAPPIPALINKQSRRPPNYENVEIKPSLPPKKRTKSFDAPQTVSLIQPEKPRSRTAVTSTYENVPPLFPFNEDSDMTGFSPPLQTNERDLDECVSSPIDIPGLSNQEQLDYSDSIQTKGEPEFRIVEPNMNDSKEDVVISSLNPNYMKVELKNRPRPVEKEEEPVCVPGRVNSPGGSVWFIPQENDPFAGLVQSSSVAGNEFVEPRERLQSVWDDKRVSHEWTQVNDFIESMHTTIQEYESNIPILVTEATPTSHETTVCTRSPVSLWLSGMRLEGLSNVFESNGFDDMEFMGGNILTMVELKEMGIHGEDQNVIAANMPRLRPPPNIRHCTTVNDWLQSLHLTSLEYYFEGYSLEKISQLWEMQLLNVLSIEELGYRKRLLYGINELRISNPEWYSNSANTALQLRQESGNTASPILQQANFTKDYRNIKSLKQQNGSVESLPSSNDLNWVESGFNRARTSHSTSSLEKCSTAAVGKQPSTDTPTTQAGYKTVPSKDKDGVSSSKENGVSSSKEDSAPSPVPIRGNEYATVRPDSGEASGRVIHPERKRVAIATPPAEVHNYNTWYLGSSMVKGVVGKHSAEEACLKLRTQTDGIAKIPQIVLSISWKGVKFVDAQSKMVVSNHLIRDISHCCPDIEDTRVFAYMTKEKETGRSYCHVFMAESKEAAEEIIITVGQAFEVAYQAVIRARGQRTHNIVDGSTETTKSRKKSPIKASFKSSFRKLNPKRKSSSFTDANSKKDIS